MYKLSLMFFSNDLRIADNATLLHAAERSAKLICVYLQQPDALYLRYSMSPSVLQRQQLFQSLDTLDLNLRGLGQHLHSVVDGSTDGLARLLERFEPCAIYRSQQADPSVESRWNAVIKLYPQVVFNQITSHTLFEQTALPFQLASLPNSFSKFRRLVEPLPISKAIAAPAQLPPPPQMADHWRQLFTPIEKRADTPIAGGEGAAAQHVTEYFKGDAAQTYKLTRNALDGWQNSTKFSLWLANGTISVRQIFQQLKHHESKHGANDSTYWIYFELLWREYFQWYAHSHGNRVIEYKGLAEISPKTSFYPERFRKWCIGNTPHPLINACMKQLNACGYMSNRGRQLAASCLVHELALDWRYGAAYMAQNLIDYDFASNWGNWQYLAGVGADPRGHRHFNLQKQTAIYDPKGHFVSLWDGAHCDSQLDSVDMVDWPITRQKSSKD